MTFFRTLAPIAAAMTVCSAAQAATVLSIGDKSDAPIYASVAAGTTATVDFDVTDPLKVTFYIVGTDTAAGNSLALTVVGIDGEASYSLTPLPSSGSLGGAYTSFSYDATGAFSLIASVDKDAPSSVSFAYSYDTSAIPVPAAGLLLGTALLGGAVAARRRRG
ncbi:hypothetical protein [Mangrovicoccus sp. HB161399]|uniref:hypothetical protein n=1 Tax=Mangrovicoccus sp. HB161399 TaxID=2720392 RepID=UPI0015561176|nr:hypothetical protein [Mangrovicoccus sp. HB161399]